MRSPSAIPKPAQRMEGDACDELVDALVRLAEAQRVHAVSSTDPSQPQRQVLVEVEHCGARFQLVRIPPEPSQRLLSPREREIARMVAKGYPNKTIAGVLDVSTWTVGTHLRRIFLKLGVGSRAAMVAKLIDSGVLEPALE